MRAFLARLLQRAQARAATLSESLDERAPAPAPEDAAAKLVRWRRALETNPGDLDAAVSLGALLVERGEVEEALPLLRRAVDSSASPELLASAHRALGAAHAARGERAAAIAHYGHALDRGLRDEAVHRDLCVMLFESGDATRATEVARRGIAAFPESSELRRFLGNLLALAGDYDGAARSYEKALSLGPPSAEIHYNHGIALGKLDRLDEAIASYRHAIALDPAHAAAHLNLANLARRQGRIAEALALHRESTRIAPDFAEAHLAEGTAHLQTGDPQRALPSLQRAVALAPTDARAHAAVGTALQDLGRLDESVAALEQSLALRPADVDTLLRAGNVLLQRGDTAGAVERYRRVLAQDPANGVAHLVKALTGGESERASDHYVKLLFDGYAARFDSHLVKELRYETPQLVAGLLAAHAGAGEPRWDVLDLGCGTGLVGAAIARHARRIVGVDLSPGMLAKARETGHYERLEAKELVEMMRGERAASYDSVTAADVFVYVGKLDDAAREIARVLRPGGLVAFSVESLDALPEAGDETMRARGYRLNSSGRYAHAIAYLRRLADEHRFTVVEQRETTLRLEKGKPVQGYVVLWRGGDGVA